VEDGSPIDYFSSRELGRTEKTIDRLTVNTQYCLRNAEKRCKKSESYRNINALTTVFDFLLGASIFCPRAKLREKQNVNVYIFI